MCQKRFPQVWHGGYGYMFLWPSHGHYYGFHLISGAEGRKDPFSSLYKYLPEAPQDIFVSIVSTALTENPNTSDVQDFGMTYFMAYFTNVGKLSNLQEYLVWLVLIQKHVNSLILTCSV